MFSKAKKSNSRKAFPGEMTEITGAEPPDTKPLAKPASKGTSKKNPPRSAAVPSIISTDVTVTGSVKADGEVQLDGTLEGNVDARRLVIGESAKVVGEITSQSVRVSGTVEGSIRADTVELCACAHVKGDIIHTALSIENGARFDGSSCYSEDPRSEAANTVAKMPGRQATAHPAPAEVVSTGGPGKDRAGSEGVGTDRTGNERAEADEVRPSATPSDVTLLKTAGRNRADDPNGADIKADVASPPETETAEGSAPTQLKSSLGRVGGALMKRQENAKPLR